MKRLMIMEQKLLIEIMILSGEMEDFNIMNRDLYENCRQQNVSSVFGARRVDGTPTINIFVLIVVKKLQTFLNAWMFGSQTGIRQNIM